MFYVYICPTLLVAQTQALLLFNLKSIIVLDDARTLTYQTWNWPVAPGFLLSVLHVFLIRVVPCGRLDGVQEKER